MLNPLEGYLLLAERLAGDPAFATAFNFGPRRGAADRRLDRRARQRARGRAASTSATAEHPPRHEAAIPSIDSTRAHTRLGWAPPWDLAAAIDMTVEWHLADRDVSLEQIERHGAMTAAAP